MMSDGKRLFVGVRVSVSTANALAQCAEMLARRANDARLDLRWVAPTNYHVTLKFLGWTHRETIGAVREALDRAVIGCTRLSFRTARLGAFPSLDKASVLWAGIEDASGLDAVAAKIDRAMTGIGFAADVRTFHAHVTLARLRETRPVRDVVLPMAEQMFSETRIDGVTLFESETKSSGSVYQEIHRATFSRPEIAAERQTSPLDPGDETDDGWPGPHGGSHAAKRQ
jgi:2'-5' RNA ligase